MRREFLDALERGGRRDAVSAPRFEAHGVLVVDKPPGPTSHDVVQVARRSFGARVGHTGTLDPLATGVLPLVLGRATRLAQFMSAGEKTYEATVVFGRETDTYDAAGADHRGDRRTPRRRRRSPRWSRRCPAAGLQTPPVYSAKKIGGEAAHRLARRDAAGRPGAGRGRDSRSDAARRATAPRPGCGCASPPGSTCGRWPTTWARQLGTGAHLGALRRVASGPFGLDDAVSWALVATQSPDLPAAVMPLERLLTDLPAAHLDAEAAAWVRHGRQVVAPVPGWPGGPATVRLFDPDGRLVGVAEAAGGPRPGRWLRGPEIAVLQPAIILG